MAEDILRRHSSWQRLRWNLLGVFLCSIAPYFFRLLTDPSIDGPDVLNLTLAGTLAASVIGVFLIRSLSSYPGVQGSVYIIPSFLSGFGIVFFTFLFARLSYSRLVFITSLILCIGWSYLVYFRAQRRRGLAIGVIPIGTAERLLSIGRINWAIMSSPDADCSALSAVAADLSADLPDVWERRLTEYALEGLPVYDSKQLQESLSGQVELKHLSENSFGGLAPVSAYMTFKHVSDWCAAALMSIALLPVLIALIVFIRIETPGPAIFRQARIGHRGRPFIMYKFRSMTMKRDENIDARTHAITQSNDQRVTRIGRLLRKSRLDELPQIFNILKGEMSWIGPRPEAEVLSRWYEVEIPFYRYRHIVRPGITGWAQVNQGHVADVDEVRQKLHYDFYYIKHYSPWLDILIVARTVRTMMTGFGAR